MTHSYSISGMSCNSCVGKIERALSELVGVESAVVGLSPPQATMVMKEHIPLAKIREAVHAAGDYSIEMADQKDGMQPKDEAGAWTKLSAYKPLILVFLYILGGSFFASLSSSGVDTSTFMRLFMAGFFLTFSFFKFLDLAGFASSYATYDVLAKVWPAYGYIYPFIELGLGIAYLTAIAPLFTYTITIIVMGFSAIGVIRSVLDKQKIKCACLGTVFDLPMSTVTIVEDISMVGMAALMLFFSMS